jgi:hypothetical protein
MNCDAAERILVHLCATKVSNLTQDICAESSAKEAYLHQQAVVYVQMPLSLHNKQLVLTYECTSNENKLI